MPEPNFTITTNLSANFLLPHFELIKLLNPKLSLKNFEIMVGDLAQNNNYKVILVHNKTECIAICGYWITTKFYSGKYLEMDNVIVKPTYQKQGIGKLISDACHKLALANNCNTMMLDAYIENEAAHRFYEREGFKKRGFHFVKKVI